MKGKTNGTELNLYDRKMTGEITISIQPNEKCEIKERE